MREKQETRLKKINNHRIPRYQTNVKQMINYRLSKLIKLIVKISNNLIVNLLKIKSGVSPTSVNDIFKFADNIYNLRNVIQLIRSHTTQSVDIIYLKYWVMLGI